MCRGCEGRSPLAVTVLTFPTTGTITVAREATTGRPPAQSVPHGGVRVPVL